MLSEDKFDTALHYLLNDIDKAHGTRKIFYYHHLVHLSKNTEVDFYGDLGLGRNLVDLAG